MAYDDIIAFLTRYMDTENRRLYIEETFRGEPIVDNLDYSGAKRVYTVRMLGDLDRYDGKAAIMRLLLVMKGHVGPNRQKEIDELIVNFTVNPMQKSDQDKREESPEKTPVDARTALAEAAEAIEEKDFDRAEQLLTDALATNPTGRLKRMLQRMLTEVEMVQEYALIRDMVRRDATREATREAGCEEFREFREDYPDYDPDGLVDDCAEAEPDDPGAAAMVRAKSFKGRHNRDWEPFVTTFEDVPIRDMTFCLVPVGSFRMGSDDGHYNDEEPVHDQTIMQPYWIAQYPVTNGQWRAGVKAGAVTPPAEGSALTWYKDPAMRDVPVVGVSWFMARDFAAWMGCRLPTELEWEYATRGVESWRYAWGDDWNPAIPVWEGNSGGKPAVVTDRPAGRSWIGAGHMIGNVWEWTSSLFEGYPYDAGDGRERDTGNSTDVRRVLRGGSFVSASVDLRAADRIRSYPSYVYYYLGGFRCARSR